MVLRDSYVKVLHFGLAKLAQETDEKDELNTEALPKYVYLTLG